MRLRSELQRAAPPSIDCDSWLVIDNFQSLNAGLPPSFLTALLEHGGTGLHIVIVTQVLGRGGYG